MRFPLILLFRTGKRGVGGTLLTYLLNELNVGPRETGPFLVPPGFNRYYLGWWLSSGPHLRTLPTPWLTHSRFIVCVAMEWPDWLCGRLVTTTLPNTRDGVSAPKRVVWGRLVWIGRESYLYMTKSYNFMIYTFLKGRSHGDVSDTPTKERKKFREVNFN